MDIEVPDSTPSSHARLVQDVEALDLNTSRCLGVAPRMAAGQSKEVLQVEIKGRLSYAVVHFVSFIKPRGNRP
jgi:hypothetical protein